MLNSIFKIDTYFYYDQFSVINDPRIKIYISITLKSPNPKIIIREEGRAFNFTWVFLIHFYF